MYGALSTVASLITPCADAKRFKKWQSILELPNDQVDDAENIAHLLRLVSDDATLL
jgi:hypothetical protein